MPLAASRLATRIWLVAGSAAYWAISFAGDTCPARAAASRSAASVAADRAELSRSGAVVAALLRDCAAPPTPASANTTSTAPRAPHQRDALIRLAPPRAPTPPVYRRW